MASKPLEDLDFSTWQAKADNPPAGGFMPRQSRSSPEKAKFVPKNGANQPWPWRERNRNLRVPCRHREPEGVRARFLDTDKAQISQ